MSEDRESHPLKVSQIKELSKQRISELERADIIRRGRPTPQLALSQESTKNGKFVLVNSLLIMYLKTK